MININFIASDNFHLDDFRDIERFINAFPDFQTVILNNEDELKILLHLLGMDEIKSQNMSNSMFPKLWDLSINKLPELNEDQFDQFYNSWLEKTNRDNNMDEYGQLIFLQGLSKKWNKLNHRLIVQEI